MKISLNWVSQWTKVPHYTTQTLEQFSHIYSTYTAEVEGIETHLYDEKIVVGKVLNWKPHPDSDKLWLVEVDAGKSGKHEIVCGAANVKTAKYVPVALENAQLPGGLVIARRPIRGIDSCGMICSVDELGLQVERAEGIFALETVWDEKILERHLWKPFGHLTLTFPVYGTKGEYAMNDVVFDLDNKFITNRPDLFSVVGNAREMACIEKVDFVPPATKLLKANTSVPVHVESEAVINYILTEYVLSDVPASPFLVQVLLRRSNQWTHGLLPDLTNIVMTEIGQPMHVFDADTLQWDITLRNAKKGEKFHGLDGKEYTLDPTDVVIVDDKKVLALAGIMGGKSSGVTQTTRRIYVESASFDAITVRKTSQRLGIRTDSSIRFEKWVDLTTPHLAQVRYAELLHFFVLSTREWSQFVLSTQYKNTHIELRHDMIVARMWKDVSIKEVETLLHHLGFSVTTKKWMYTITVPSWRNTGDITLPEDIIEEIARHIGYETIPGEALPGPIWTARIHSHDIVTMNIANFFADRGYFDAYTYPFTLAERFERFSDIKPSVIHNTTENRTHLRAHVAENLLELVASHYREYAEGAFFEFGSIFDGSETLQGVGILWGNKKIDVLQEDLTSYMMTFFGNSGSIVQGTSDTKLFAPKAYGEIMDTNGDIVLRFGLVRPTLLPLFDIEGIDAYAFEIVKLPVPDRPICFIPLPEFPGTRRELNFIMPETTPVATVTRLVAESHDWVSEIGVSEIYRDEKHIGIDKKSVVVSFLIRNPHATITDEEAAKVQESVVQKLDGEWYVLRGV